jgi:hypothetical protein
VKPSAWISSTKFRWADLLSDLLIWAGAASRGKGNKIMSNGSNEGRVKIARRIFLAVGIAVVLLIALVVGINLAVGHPKLTAAPAATTAPAPATSASSAPSTSAEPVSTKVCHELQGEWAGVGNMTDAQGMALANKIMAQAETIPGSELYVATSQTPDLKASLEGFARTSSWARRARTAAFLPALRHSARTS